MARVAPSGEKPSALSSFAWDLLRHSGAQLTGGGEEPAADGASAAAEILAAEQAKRQVTSGGLSNLSMLSR